MDNFEDILHTLHDLYPYCLDIAEFLVWYFNNIAIYPGICLLSCIILQYITRNGSKIRFFACYGTYFIYPMFFGVIVWPFFVLNMRQGVLNCLYGAYICRPVAKLLGMQFELKNGEVLSKERGTAVVIANHQSFFDVLGMFTIWHVMEKCTAIARKKVFYIWPFGLLAWIAGVVFIDRVPAYDKTYQTVNKAAEYVCQQKAKLWMFPEGTRNRNPEKLLPFKKGAFRVAICCQLPIIPVIFSPYYFISGKQFYFGKGKVIIEALEPIPTKGLTLDDIDDLMKKVYKIMSDKNDEIRKALKEEYKQGKLECCKNL